MDLDSWNPMKVLHKINWNQNTTFKPINPIYLKLINQRWICHLTSLTSKKIEEQDDDEQVARVKGDEQWWAVVNEVNGSGVRLQQKTTLIIDKKV